MTVRAPKPTRRQLVKALTSGETRTEEDIWGDEAPTEADRKAVEGGRVEHITPGMVTLYKPNPPFGYLPRQVPVSNIDICLDNGFLVDCPDCGQDCGIDPNSCTGRAPRAFRQCQFCGKKCYDPMTGAGLGVVDTEDPNLIQDEHSSLATPALRTKAVLDAHQLAFHPTEAVAAGARPLRRIEDSPLTKTERERGV
jgi:hypothetical protein